MISTLEWAKSLDISSEYNPPPLEGVTYSCPYTARDIAVRAVILQGVVAVASQVDPGPVIEWFLDQGIWEEATPREQLFLLLPSRSDDECIGYEWHVEAEWTLLWAINKVEALGLPTRKCDTRRLMEEIIPALWSDIDEFLTSAELRHPDIL